jgi:DNA replication protein DnaC
VKICSDTNIYLEITISSESNEDKDDKSKKMSVSYKQYLCKISTPGRNTEVLHKFLEKCIEEHNVYLKKNTSKQYIFEYSKTDYDENDRKVAKYIETPFISNKHLAKNIFFPEKEQFITQLDKFVNNREKHKAEYEESGQTYKLSVVLHGPPGTGKTCIVRGMLNYTGRDAILVPWSRIKTCGELSSILRTNKFNGKTKEFKDLIFIFEVDRGFSKFKRDWYALCKSYELE